MCFALLYNFPTAGDCCPLAKTNAHPPLFGKRHSWASVVSTHRAKVLRNTANTDNMSDRKVPSRIGRFDIKKQLGRGAFGTVYLAIDLLPENILLQKDGVPFLVDFGLARRDSVDVQQIQDGMVLGTPATMSPEQASGHGASSDGRTDQWSLGVILYELLTGVRPFAGNQVPIMYAIQHSEVASPRSIDPTIPIDLDSKEYFRREREGSFLDSTTLTLIPQQGGSWRVEILGTPRIPAIDATFSDDSMKLYVYHLKSNRVMQWDVAAQTKDPIRRLTLPSANGLGSIAFYTEKNQIHLAYPGHLVSIDSSNLEIVSQSGFNFPEDSSEGLCFSRNGRLIALPVLRQGNKKQASGIHLCEVSVCDAPFSQVTYRIPMIGMKAIA